MIQDILPHQYDVSFRHAEARAEDFVFIFQKGQALLRNEGGRPAVPTCGEVWARWPEMELTFLFSIDEANIFMAEAGELEPEGLTSHDTQIFRELDPPWLAFAGATASHLAVWRDKTRFCGRCAAVMKPSETERAMVCPACGNIVYPAIAPVVIVGVIDGERLLLTRYAGRVYRRPALVAGFVEIGETLEDAVRREVREEVGLELKNIRYYKSQPWAFSQSLLSGFFADLDGPADIRLDVSELSEGFWVNRDEVPDDEDLSNVSLTYEMIRTFRRLGPDGV
ncbi:MAG: NAD(+) diphosphatase [Candidatus Adiutrix sp.]|jgi:NAD+ diphosphatase|nr:NAD(+) diphosphatase [Candidatus Adiutrix sp.]